MAVFQGARLRDQGSLGVAARRSARIATPAKAGTPATAGSTPRIRPTGLLMAAILTATMLGLVYLTQTLASNATSLEIRSLAEDSQVLHQQLLNQKTKVELEANPDAVVRAAKRLGLKQLDDPIVLKAP